MNIDITTKNQQKLNKFQHDCINNNADIAEVDKNRINNN